MDHRKVLISALFIEPGKVGGAEHYLTNILKGFTQIGCEDRFTLVLDQNLIGHYDSVYDQFEHVALNISGNRRIHDLGLGLKLNLNKYKTIYQPQYVTPLSRVKGTKFITTIHDLKYRHFPQLTGKGKRLWSDISISHTLKKCDKIICISEFVRNDIIRHFGEKYSEKLTVIHNPVDFERFSTSSDHQSEPYILSVNSFWQHKNTLSLILAYKAAKSANPSIPKLVLVGQMPENLLGGEPGGYQNKIVDQIKDDNSIQLTGYVDDQELREWYRSARIFINTSLFEGFGMTAVEAMGLGIPTLTSAKTSLREVTLNKAIYLDDPLDIEEITTKLLVLLKDEAKERRRFRALSEEIQYKYAPKKIADKYLQILDY